MNIYLLIVTCFVIPCLAATLGKLPNSKNDKRSVLIGDLSYSYAATDIDSKNGSRVKTVTVIKNIAAPKLYDKTEHHSNEEKVDKKKQENENFEIHFKIPEIEEAYAQIESLNKKIENKYEEKNDKKLVGELSGGPIRFPKDDLYNVKHLSEVSKTESKEKQSDGKKEKYQYIPPYVAPVVRDGGKVTNSAQKTPFIVIDFSKKSGKKEEAKIVAPVEPVQVAPIKEPAAAPETTGETAAGDPPLAAAPNNYREIRTRYPHARVLYKSFG